MKLLYIFLSTLLSTILIGSSVTATSYTWTGTTDTTWANSNNWSPNGVPGSGDNVTVFSNTNSPSISANTTITNLTFPSDTLRLNGNTLTVNGTCALTGGTVTAGKLTCRGTFVNFAGSTLKCYVDAVCGQIKFNGSVFDSTAYIEQTGFANGVGAGGNIFNQAVTIKNSSPYILRTAESTGDVFNADLTLVVTNIKDIQLSYAAASIYNGNVYLNTTSTGGIAFSTTGNGSSTLAFGKQLIIGGSGFANGVLLLNNIIQQGSTAQSIALSAGTLNIIGSTFNGPVTFSAANILSKASTFNATTSLTKTGISNNYWDGGNTFNGTTTITNSTPGNYNLRMSLTTGDVYAGDITFNASSTFTGAINVAYAGTTEFKGNVSINNSKVTFNAGTGTVKFSGSNNQTLSGSATYAMLDMIVNKSSNTLTLNQSMTVDSSLTLTKGNIISTTSYLLTMKAGSSVSGASDSSYVDGPVKKIGNSAFTFPTGKGGNYRGISISAPTIASDAFTGEFINSEQALGTYTDSTIMNVSNCEYWTLNRNTGSSNVSIKLNWISSSCFLGALGEKRVASWSGSEWLNIGNASTDGSINSGSITSSTNTGAYNAFGLSQTRKGNICSNVINLAASCRDSAIGLTDSIMWFSFTADTARNVITFYPYNNITGWTPAILVKAWLYSGNCNNLVLRDSSVMHPLDSLLQISDTLLIPGHTYYVKLKGTLSCSNCAQIPNGYFNFCRTYSPLYIQNNCGLSLPSCNLLYNSNFNHAIDPAIPYTDKPFNNLLGEYNVCSWIATHGTPQVGNGLTSNYAYMWASETYYGEGIMQQINLSHDTTYLLHYKYVFGGGYSTTPTPVTSLDSLLIKLTDSSYGIIPTVTLATIPTVPSQTIDKISNITTTTWLDRFKCFTPDSGMNVIFIYPQDDITPGPSRSDVLISDIEVFPIIVNAGRDTTIHCNAPIQLGLSTCITTYTNQIGYLWTLVSGSLPSGLSNPYIYNPTITLQNNTGSAITQIYQVQLTISGGCSVRDTIKITVLPSMSLTTSMGEACYGSNNGQLIINVANGIAPYIYQWSGPSSGTVHDQSLSTYSLTSLYSGVYTITVTDSSGCQVTTVVTLDSTDNCNCFIDYTFPSTTYSINLLTTLFPPNGGGNMYSGKRFYIPSGTFYVDNSIIFKHCTIFLGVDARIIVVRDSGNLQFIDQTVIKGCDNMWLYIEVQSGGVISMDASTMRDAIDGIKLYDGANYTISNDTFDFNRYSIQAFSGNYTGKGVIYNNVFRCTGPLFSTFGNQTQSHINVVGVTGFKIGTSNIAGSTFLGNIFTQAIYGIYTTNSQVFSYKNNFSNNITSGIFAIKNSSIVVQNDNRFGANGVGIVARSNTSINVDGNTFISNRYDIISAFNSKQTIQITNNELSHAIAGSILNLFNYPATTKITDNQITFFSRPDAFGIWVVDGIVNAGSTINIEDNVLNGCGQGIIVSSAFGALIHENNINLPANPNGLTMFGIRATNFNSNIIKHNHIRGFSYTDDNATGIYQSYGDKNRILCNDMHNIGLGMFYDNTAFKCQFAGNIMDSCNYHLYIANNSAGLGSQGSATFPSDNEWKGVVGNAQTFTSSANNVSTNTTFYVRPGAPTEPTVNSTNGNNSQVVFISPFSYTGSDYCDTVPAFTPDNAELIRLAMDSIDFGDALTIKWEYKKSLYKDLMEDAVLTASSDDLGEAMDSLAVTIIGDFKVVDDSVIYYVNDSTITDSVKVLRAAEVESFNNTLGTLRTVEENTKMVNTIYLATVARGNSDFTSTQIEQLRSVAVQCPDEGGRAVYLACDMLLIIDSIYTYYDANCESGSRTVHVSSKSGERVEEVYIYPNPTKGVISISGIGNSGRIQIQDITGRIILNKQLNSNNNLSTISINELIDGAYFCLLYEDEELIKTVRLVMIK